jgi:7-cyano-7-deazaguanine reductase
MAELETVPNATTTCRILEQHILEIPPCCPKSKNPRPGSTITIQYRPRGYSLEIGSLIRYIHTFVGGKRDISGSLEVRDMEGMICRIAQDCACVLGVPVRVTAQLLLLPRQQMYLVARGYP